MIKGDLTKKKDKNDEEENNEETDEEEEETVDMRKTDEGYYVCQETVECQDGSTTGCSLYGRSCYTQFVNDELYCRGRNEKGKITMEKAFCKDGYAKNYSSYNRNGPTTYANGDREMNAPQYNPGDRPGWNNAEGVPYWNGAPVYQRRYFANNVLVVRPVPTMVYQVWPPRVRVWVPPVNCGIPGACGGGYPPRGPYR